MIYKIRSRSPNCTVKICTGPATLFVLEQCLRNMMQLQDIVFWVLELFGKGTGPCRRSFSLQILKRGAFECVRVCIYAIVILTFNHPVQVGTVLETVTREFLE